MLAKQISEHRLVILASMQMFHDILTGQKLQSLVTVLGRVTTIHKPILFSVSSEYNGRYDKLLFSSGCPLYF